MTSRRAVPSSANEDPERRPLRPAISDSDAGRPRLSTVLPDPMRSPVVSIVVIGRCPGPGCPEPVASPVLQLTRQLNRNATAVGRQHGVEEAGDQPVDPDGTGTIAAID